MRGGAILLLALAGLFAAASDANDLVYSEAVTELLQIYGAEASAPFSAVEGEDFWFQDRDGRACTSCHSESLMETGLHQKTGKLIEPMAPSVNPERLTEVRKIKKWFLRNCKWTLKRECTAQEKGDILVWLITQ